MLRFFARRAALMVAMLLMLLALTFVISHIAPGDPAALAAGPDASREMIEQLRERMGLDRPLYEQFFRYVAGILHGDLGRSIHTGKAVAEDLARYFPASLELVLVSIVIAIAIGIPLGVASAFVQNSWIDHAIRIFSTSGVGLPMFWLGLLLQQWLSLGWDAFPLGGRLDILTDPPPAITGFYGFDALLSGQFAVIPDFLSHITLPAITLCFPALASIIRVNRAEMLETLRQDYVVSARAQGISTFRVVGIYALKNAMLPTLAMIGLRFGWMLGGTVLVETVFDWPGIGLYAVQAAVSSDFEPIMAVTVLVGLSFMVVNFVMDLLYAAIDPRIRVSL